MEIATKFNKRDPECNPLKMIPSANRILRSKKIDGKWVIEKIDGLSQDLLSLRRDLLRRMEK